MAPRRRTRALEDDRPAGGLISWGQFFVTETVTRAGAIGMAFGTEYYNQIAKEYRDRREVMCGALKDTGFKFTAPEGAYYILADSTEISDLRGIDFAIWLAKEIGVATVPGTSFYSDPKMGEHVTRFAFCKKPETLERAAERLAGMTAKV